MSPKKVKKQRPTVAEMKDLKTKAEMAQLFERDLKELRMSLHNTNQDLLKKVQELKQKDLDIASLNESVKRLRERDDMKQQKLVFMQQLRDQDALTIANLKKMAEKSLKVIFERGRIRASYDPTYAIVRDTIFATVFNIDEKEPKQKVMGERLLKDVLKAHPQLDVMEVGKIVEEIQGQFFTEEEKARIINEVRIARGNGWSSAVRNSEYAYSAVGMVDKIFKLTQDEIHKEEDKKALNNQPES